MSLLVTGPRPNLIQRFLGSLWVCLSQSASRSIQSFLHSSAVCSQTHRHAVACHIWSRRPNLHMRAAMWPKNVVFQSTTLNDEANWDKMSAVSFLWQVALLSQRDRATCLSVEILQLQNIAIVWHYLRDPTFSRFYTIQKCDKHTHTDGRTDTRRRHVLRLA